MLSAANSLLPQEKLTPQPFLLGSQNTCILTSPPIDTLLVFSGSQHRWTECYLSLIWLLTRSVLSYCGRLGPGEVPGPKRSGPTKTRRARLPGQFHDSSSQTCWHNHHPYHHATCMRPSSQHLCSLLSFLLLLCPTWLPAKAHPCP